MRLAGALQGAGRLAIHPGHEVPAVAFIAHVKRINNEAHFRLRTTDHEFVRWDRCELVRIDVLIGAEHTPAREVAFCIDQQELELMADKVMLN